MRFYGRGFLQHRYRCVYAKPRRVGSKIRSLPHFFACKLCVASRRPAGHLQVEEERSEYVCKRVCEGGGLQEADICFCRRCFFSRFLF